MKKSAKRGGGVGKTERQASGAASSGAGAKKGATDDGGALTGRARKAVEEALSLAKTVYGIDVEGLAGPEVQRRIAAKVGEVRGREMKISEVSMMGSVLSVAWGEAICRELGWEWVMVKGVAAVASANRSHVVYPVTYFCNGIARGGVEPLGLYEKIKSGELVEAGAGAMVEVG